MDNKNRILWITRTAVFIALLIVLQLATAPLGNTIVTGTIVNLILIVSVMTYGLAPGLTVAAVSPVAAKFLGIGPLWTLIPFIILGNIVLVVIWHFIGNLFAKERKGAAYVAALVIAAIAKFLTLYIGIVKISIPVFLNLPEKQAIIISNMFSVPQLITAFIGGVIAAVILPTLKKAIGENPTAKK